MSQDKSYYLLMASYNRWVNEALYDACARVPDAERRADRGIYYRSIHGTLNHLLYGDRSWMRRFTGTPFPFPDSRVELYADFETLRQERAKTDQQIQDWVEALTPEWLQAPFSYHSNIDGVTRVLPTWTLVVHMFNHQTHHRGQLTTLLGQLGYDYPTMDIPWMLTPPVADTAQ